MDDSAARADQGAAPARYRCNACGNLTRFEITETRRTRAFHHYTVGGDLSIEESTVLESDVESVVCRWCGTGASVVQIDADAADSDGAAPDAADVVAGTEADDVDLAPKG